LPSSVLYGTVGTLVVLALWKALQARTGETRISLLYATGFLASLAAATGLLAPESQLFISRFEPVPNLSRLVGNVATSFGAVCVHGMTVHLRWRDSALARRRQARIVVGFVAASVVMAVLFFAAGTKFTVDFLAVYAGDHRVAAYLLIQLVFVLTAVFSSLTVAVPLYRESTGLVRSSVGCFMIALAFFSAWGVWKVSLVVLRAVTGTVVMAEGPVSLAVGTVASVFFSASLMLGVMCSFLGAPGLTLAAYRDWRRLEPLWLQVTGAVPDVVLELPAVRGFSLRRIRMARYRRLIEISDAVCVLAPWAHPDAEMWSREMAAEAGVADRRQVQAIVGAATLMTALDAHGGANNRDGRHQDRSTPPAQLLLDLAESHAVHLQIEAFSSPVVAAVRARANGRSL
jgi:hypothetical protein